MFIGFSEKSIYLFIYKPFNILEQLIYKQLDYQHPAHFYFSLTLVVGLLVLSTILKKESSILIYIFILSS